jgi:phosphate ABC transporter phosphate-binding protein
MTIQAIMHRILRWRKLGTLGWLVLLVCGSWATLQAESIETLAQVKKLYIADFHGGQEAAHLRGSFLRHLVRDHFEIVQSPKDADAVLNGTGEVWLKGYVSISARTPASDRQAVYAGYLSIEVNGRDGQPLWSWLATPGKLAWTNIVDNLASRAAKQLTEAAKSQPTTAAAAASSTSTLAPTELTAAGATFPAPLYQKWFQDFEELHPGVHFRYAAVGSEAGVHKLMAGEIDFAGSDVVPETVAGTSAAEHLQRIPSVLGAVVPIYNLSGVTQDVRFTPEALAGIFLGQAKQWNDEALKRWNRGIDLPRAPITVIHRSDGSGTTWVWSDYLTKVSPAWATAVGRGTTLRWPVGTGAAGNDGVAEAVLNTPNSIGYVELTYAIQHRLAYGSVRNRAGEFVRADLDSVSEAAKGVVLSAGHDPTITDSTARFAYPISAFTWLVMPGESSSPAKHTVLEDLFHWALVYGQRDCSALGYAPLPREVVDEELRILHATK